MGFIYLDGKNWIDVTREERLFCSYLYWDIKKSVKDFVSWLSTISGLALRFDDTWEVGYEVCFYRDLQKFRRKPLDLTRYSRKRTFDICLFSESTIVIIEAKVQSERGASHHTYEKAYPRLPHHDCNRISSLFRTTTHVADIRRFRPQHGAKLLHRSAIAGK